MTSSLIPLITGGTLDALTCLSIAFLVASGLTVVFGLLGFLNAAHTSFYMIAAYFAYSIARVTGNFWIALLVAPVAVTLLGFAIERTLFRRLYAMGHTAQLLYTIGLGYVIAELCKLAWGDSTFSLAPPASLAGRITLFGATLPAYHLFICAVALALLGVLGVLLTRTRLGLVVRAASSYPEMVGALGFNVRNVYSLVFAVGVFLAAVAGVVVVPLTGAQPGMADEALVQAFIVVVAGGLGSLPGALVASTLMGLLQGYGSVFFSGYALFFPYVVLGAVLLVRPTGLFAPRSV
jgi:branched-chain amino acid transport system permease protein